MTRNREILHNTYLLGLLDSLPANKFDMYVMLHGRRNIVQIIFTKLSGAWPANRSPKVIMYTYNASRESVISNRLLFFYLFLA